MLFIGAYSNKKCLRWSGDAQRALTFSSKAAAESSWMCGFPWGTRPVELAAVPVTQRQVNHSPNPFAGFIQ